MCIASEHERTDWIENPGKKSEGRRSEEIESAKTYRYYGCIIICTAQIAMHWGFDRGSLPYRYFAVGTLLVLLPGEW